MLEFYLIIVKKEGLPLFERITIFILFFPLVLFLVLYLGSGLYFTCQGHMDGFYQVSPLACAIPALTFGILFGKRAKNHNLNSMINGMRHPDIITMCLIFLLAGAFTQVTQRLGCVDATVAVAIKAMPPEFLLLGIFLVSSFISTSIGTSMGVIALVGPIAFGLGQQGAFPIPLGMATVVGGAMFGDNLSLISDTTIAAVQSLGADYREKFKLNALIAAISGVITCFVLFFSHSCCHAIEDTAISYSLLLPYGIILGAGLLGLNVFAVLLLGLASAFLLDISTTQVGFLILTQEMTAGMIKMSDIMILSLCVGGMSGLLKDQGALTRLGQKITALAQKKNGAKTVELLMAALSSLFDLLVANNTIAIILAGSLAKDLSHTFKMAPHRLAYIIDTFSCVFQGLIPYGAQVLLVCKIAHVTPFDVIPHVYYCYILGAVTFLEILWKKHPKILETHKNA